MSKNSKKTENESLDLSKLPGYLDPMDLDLIKIEEYEEKFRKGKNTRLTDGMIKNFLLAYVIENSIDAATSQGSLIFQLDEESKRKFNDRIRNEISEFLFEEFIKINGTFKEDDYETWHSSLCEELKKKCEPLKSENGNESRWTYGNSQKVVNLIIKYLVIISNRAKKIEVSNETTKIGDVFAGMKECLDIPVDRYIIEASINHNKKDPDRQLMLPPLEDNTRRNSEHRKPQIKFWSKWNKEDCKAYSESLHKVFDCPFDWEGYAWTEAKELEKNKHKRRKTNKRQDKIVNSEEKQ